MLHGRRFWWLLAAGVPLLFWVVVVIAGSINGKTPGEHSWFVTQDAAVIATGIAQAIAALLIVRQISFQHADHDASMIRETCDRLDELMALMMTTVAEYQLIATLGRTCEHRVSEAEKRHGSGHKRLKTECNKAIAAFDSAMARLEPQRQAVHMATNRLRPMITDRFRSTDAMKDLEHVANQLADAVDKKRDQTKTAREYFRKRRDWRSGPRPNDNFAALADNVLPQRDAAIAFSRDWRSRAYEIAAGRRAAG